MNKTGNITFYATLARTKEVFWVQEESNSLSLSALEDNKPIIAATQKTIEMSTTKKVIVPSASISATQLTIEMSKKAIVSSKNVTSTTMSTTENVVRTSPTSVS